MREINNNEISAVSGGAPVWFAVVGIVLTAIAITDGVNDFIDGYNDARENK